MVKQTPRHTYFHTVMYIQITKFDSWVPYVLDLQPISWESPVNVARPLRLMSTIELIKYSFVPHHQHGQRASRELQGNELNFTRDIGVQEIVKILLQNG